MINIKPYNSPLGKCYSCRSDKALYQIVFDTKTNKALSVTTVLLCKSCMKLLKDTIKE